MKTYERGVWRIRTALLPLGAGAATLLLGGAPQAGHLRRTAEPFKVANVHFETNASACDMGIQFAFDTEGITAGTIMDPKHRTVYRFGSAHGMRALGGQTEGFLEGVEPQISELLEGLGCDPSDEEEEISLGELFAAFPEGDYTFIGRGPDTRYRDKATLSYAIPAGPEILAPLEGEVVPDDAPVLIEWEPVTEAILTSDPDLGPVDIVGYHVIVVEGGGEALPQLDVDVSADETSVSIPEQYLEPGTFYDFEVLVTEASGNQTISEGSFCTTGLSPCEEP